MKEKRGKVLFSCALFCYSRRLAWCSKMSPFTWWQIYKSSSDSIVLLIVVYFSCFLFHLYSYFLTSKKIFRKSLVIFLFASGVNMKKIIQIVAVYKYKNGERHKWHKPNKRSNKRFKERKKYIQHFGRMKNGLFVFKWSTKICRCIQTKRPKTICNAKDWKYPAAQSNLFVFNI